MNPQPLMPLRPIRWSVAAISLAVMTSLALIATIKGSSNLEITYLNFLNEQSASVAASQTRNNTETPAPETEADDSTNRIIVKWTDENLPEGMAMAAAKANLEQEYGLVKIVSSNGLGIDVYEVSENDSAEEVVDRMLSGNRDLVTYVETDGTNSGFVYTQQASAATSETDGEVDAAVDATDTLSISNYAVSSKSSDSATITATLSVPGSVTIVYGTAKSGLNMSAQGTSTATTHAVTLTGLSANTTYYYQVIASNDSATTASLTSSFRTGKATGRTR